MFTAYYKKDPKIQDAHAESLVSTEQEGQTIPVQYTYLGVLQFFSAF